MITNGCCGGGASYPGMAASSPGTRSAARPTTTASPAASEDAERGPTGARCAPGATTRTRGVATSRASGEQPERAAVGEEGVRRRHEQAPRPARPPGAATGRAAGRSRGAAPPRGPRAGPTARAATAGAAPRTVVDVLTAPPPPGDESPEDVPVDVDHVNSSSISTSSPSTSTSNSARTSSGMRDSTVTPPGILELRRRRRARRPGTGHAARRRLPPAQRLLLLELDIGHSRSLPATTRHGQAHCRRAVPPPAHPLQVIPAQPGPGA